MLKVFRDLLILVALILLLLVISAFFKEQLMFDIQLHDTYIVVAWPGIIIFLGGPVIVVIYFFRGFVKKFKEAGTNACLILGLLAISYSTLIAVQIFDYRFGKAWVILMLSVISILFLVVRTINVWRHEASQSEK